MSSDTLHKATSAFWENYDSLRFKKLGERKGQELWSARITLNYRALAIRLPEEFLWFWIGEHGVYDDLTG